MYGIMSQFLLSYDSMGVDKVGPLNEKRDGARERTEKCTCQDLKPEQWETKRAL